MHCRILCRPQRLRFEDPFFLSSFDVGVMVDLVNVQSSVPISFVLLSGRAANYLSNTSQYTKSTTREKTHQPYTLPNISDI